MGIPASERPHRRACVHGSAAAWCAWSWFSGWALHLWLYNDVIVDTFYRAPAQLANAIIGTSDPIDTVDAIWNRGGAVAENVKHLGSGFLSGFGFELESLIVWFLTGRALRLRDVPDLAIEHCFIGTACCRSPIGRLLLFDGTRRLFEAWVVQLVNYALITILTVLVAALLLHLVESYAAQTAARGSALTGVDALDMLLVMGLVLLLLRQIMPIAAGLAGRRGFEQPGCARRSPAMGQVLAPAGRAGRLGGGAAISGAASGRSAYRASDCGELQDADRARRAGRGHPLVARRRALMRWLSIACLILTGCVTRDVHCDSRLRPINAAAECATGRVRLLRRPLCPPPGHRSCRRGHRREFLRGC